MTIFIAVIPRAEPLDFWSDGCNVRANRV
jgi:hypothetical protein